MKTTSNQLMAMLVLGLLPIATKALNCSSPPVPATRAWVDNITSGSDSGCTVVNGDLHLGRNCPAFNTCLEPQPTLAGAVDLGAVKTITGRLTCLYNLDLTSVDLGALQTVGGYLRIYNNKALTSMNLGALQTIEGDLTIGNNKALTSMNLGALQTIGGDLDIYSNDALTSMDLGALQTIGGFLSIRSNAALTSVGLGALQTVGDKLYIYLLDNMNPLDIEVNEKSPVLGCVDSKAMPCPGVVLKIRALTTKELEAMKRRHEAWLGRLWQNMPWRKQSWPVASTNVAAGVEARTQTPFTTEANSAPTQAPLATEASSAPSCISFSLVLVPILAVWAMVVQA